MTTWVKAVLLVVVLLSASEVCFAQGWPPWANDLFYRDGPSRNYDREEFDPPPRRLPRETGGDVRDGGGRPTIAPAAPPIVAFPHSFPMNSIVIDTGGRKLYFVLENNRAYEYQISVGREGFNWTGTETVSRKQEWPDWHPPAEMRERDPSLPEKMTGGVKNPLGAVALYLGKTLYRIHGTNDVKSIGRAQSSGCFRMLNGAVVHLASITEIGTSVTVVNSLPGRSEVSGTQPSTPAFGSKKPAETTEPSVVEKRAQTEDYRSLRDYALGKK